MSLTLVIAAVCLLAQVGQPYILLTANVEDLRALAKQVMGSPIGARLGKIWLRADQQFHQALAQGKRRANRRFSADEETEEETPDSEGFTRGPVYRKRQSENKHQQ